ncbi:MAG TPA: periplasmic heavy metal sensor [Candidatus Tectomicrobia bacterium]
MQHISCKAAGVTLALAAILVGGVQAQQQHQQHHPGGAQAPQQQPAETGTGAPAQPQPMQGMMDTMQGMMQHMQGMMERMQGMMGRRDMAAQEEEDDEDASPPRGMMGMMGPGGMMRRHMERLAQQLELTDDQRMQVRTLLGNHAKEAIRLRADLGVMAVDVRQLLETDPVDLPKVKQQLQSIASKEVDLRLAHITLRQEISKVLTPEQRQKFRAMRENMMAPGGMRGMMGPSGMMGRGRHER